MHVHSCMTIVCRCVCHNFAFQFQESPKSNRKIYSPLFFHQVSAFKKVILKSYPMYSVMRRNSWSWILLEVMPVVCGHPMEIALACMYATNSFISPQEGTQSTHPQTDI